jgi:amino acid adenylation domain-containing protein
MASNVSRGPSAAAPVAPTLGRLLAETAAGWPGADAVIASDGVLTYASLYSRASSLARALRRQGVTPGAAVPLIAGRGKDVAVGIAGILHCGAAYVPIDASYPQHVVAGLVRDCDAAVGVTDGSAELPSSGVSWIRVPDADGHDGNGGPNDEPADVAADAPAVIVYTSGSTGRPKGVVLSHHAVMARIERGYPRRPNDLQRASISVGAHVSDFVVPLVTGGPVILVDQMARRDVARLADYIDRYRPTRLVFVPSVLRTVLEAGPAGQRCLVGVDTVIVSGESLPPAVAAAFLSRFPDIRLLNAFGSTELAGFACMGEITSADDIHVGQPIPGMIVRVMSESLRRCRTEEPGEICVGGDQLASGYWNDPVLTASHFVDDPEDRQRLYRTGDLGVATANGMVRVIGRIGLQVKVRGFRVNLAGIEMAIEEHEQVSRAMVTVYGDGEAQLHALVTGRTPDLDADALRSFLAPRVPAAMVPRRISIVSELPLLPNHKLNRVAADAVARELRATTSDATADLVATPTEQRLATLWADILGVPAVARTDDFFRLGGDSLAAMRMVSRAELLGIRVPVEAVFEGCSLAQLATLASAGQ